MAAAAGGTGEDPVSNNGPIAPGQSSEGVSTDAAAAADINRESDGSGGRERAMSMAGASGGVKDKDRKIGHRRVNEDGEVSYKKVQSNQLTLSIQMGIRHAIGYQFKADERDLLMQDFMTVDTYMFPKTGTTGESPTPAHKFSDFKFQTYAPQAFRKFLNLFHIKKDDFMMSLCNEPLRELTNPGASGSMFFLTNDDEFIIKTVQHKEAEFLQKLLPGYYINLMQNPKTLLPKFFGMFNYQFNHKNIRLIVMNNLLPSAIKMHLKFDLKGSTYKRKASKRERAKSSPTFKDLDFRDELLPDGLSLEPVTYNALMVTIQRDCRVLESFRIMDYSLLVGIHNLDLAAKDNEESTVSSSAWARVQKRVQKTKLVAHSTAMEAIQAEHHSEPIDEEEHLPPGGIPARNHKGERLLLYLGVIDILQSYRLFKRAEHTLKAIIADGDSVSVHNPGFYAKRFLDFVAETVFKKIPSPLKHSPSRKTGRGEVSLKRASTSGQQQQQRMASDGQVDIQQAERQTTEGTEVAAAVIETDPEDATKATSVVVNSSQEETKEGDFFSRGSAKPDVVPGDYDAAEAAYYTAASSISNTATTSHHYQNRSSSVSATASVRSMSDHNTAATHSPGMARKKMPINKQHAALRQQSVSESSTCGGVGIGGTVGSSADSLHHHQGQATRDGTPSRLSIGSGWASTPGHTWATEGTPSYTPSSLSRDSSLSVGGGSSHLHHHHPSAGQSSFDDVCDETLQVEI